MSTTFLISPPPEFIDLPTALHYRRCDNTQTYIQYLLFMYLQQKISNMVPVHISRMVFFLVGLGPYQDLLSMEYKQQEKFVLQMRECKLYQQKNLQTCYDDCKHVRTMQTPPYVYAVVGLFWFYRVQATTAQLRRFSLLKPFLTFKSHRNTLLRAQNVAKASKID